MATEQDIEFLRDFREKIERYLYLGVAPEQSDMFPNPAFGEMQARLRDDPSYRNLRREINEAKGRARTSSSRVSVSPTSSCSTRRPRSGARS